MKTHILLSSYFFLLSFSVFGQLSSTGMVAYYPFNGNANDESGNGINSTYIGTGVTLTSDRFGNPDKAYSFDGNTGSYIRMPADILPTTNRTISLWFNVPDIAGRPGLLGYGGNGSCGTSLFMGLNCSGSAKFWAQGHCGNNQAGYSYSAEPINKWYHWVLTIDGNTQKIYVNGELKSTDNTFSGSTAVAGKDLSLGVITSINGTAPYTDTNVGYLTGKLDDVRIYNSALTDEQVHQLYSSESSGLVAYYPFNGNANDESITANHATIYGSTLITDRNNISGKAYSFNGSSDRLQVPENDAYDFGDGDFSITSWVSLNEIKTARIVSAGHRIDDGIWGLGFGSHPVWGSGLRINYFVYSGGAYRDFSSDEITGYTLGQWAMVGITKTGSTITFYFNGKKAGTATISLVSNAGSYLSIGSRQDASETHIEFLNGKIDEVRIYNHGLSETEIIEDYNSTRNCLVAYYPFNGNANDESGNGHDGSVSGATKTTDRFNQADNAYNFVYNGFSSDKIQVSGTSDLNFSTGTFSIGAWVKFSGAATGGYNYPIFSKHICGEQSGYILMLYNGKLTFWLAGSEGYNVLSTTDEYTDNCWHQVVAVYDGTTQYLYVDGVLKNSIPFSYTSFNSANWALGGYNGCNGGFNGKVDEIKVFDQALTETEVQNLYNNSVNPLIAYYPFNGNANDESGNGNHGTITGPLVTPAVDWYGEEGKAYKFWFPDYVSVPTNASFFTDEFTVSYWYKVASYWGDRGVLSCVGNKGGYQQAFSGTTFSSIIGYNFPLGAHLYSNYTVPDVTNTWHHVVLFYKKTGDNLSSTKLFLNGELKKTENHSLAIAYPGGEIFYIGRNHGELGFNGELDDVRFYNRELSDTEIMALHTAETPTAVKNQFIPDVRISPIPIDEHFVVDLRSNFQKIELRILDMTGRVIKKFQYTDLQQLTIYLDAPSGIYFLNITTEKGQGTYKLMKR